MDSIKKQFAELHKGDLRTLLKIYWENKPIFLSQYFWIAMICTIVVTVLPHFLIISKLGLIEFLAKMAISIFPSILGFNLGGYILLISLNSSNILDELTDPIEEKGEKYSFYQKMSSVFAFSILLQALTLIIGFIFWLIIDVGRNVEIAYSVAEILNFIALFTLCFIMSYATLLICQIVLNVFNFGQVQHFFIRINNIDKRNSK